MISLLNTIELTRKRYSFVLINLINFFKKEHMSDRLTPYNHKTLNFYSIKNQKNCF